MSACSYYFFRSCAQDHVHVFADTRAVTRNATTEVEPLAPFAGAAAFLIARSRWCRSPRASVKEPIEDQANRHY
jgi:hypothetical protein